MKRGAARAVALLAVGLVLVVLAVGAPDDDGDRPLDPRGTGPTGTRALVLLLGELGARAEVVRGAPARRADTALLLRDDLAERDRAALVHWIDDGGVLLLADQGSPLTSTVGLRSAPCPAALDGVGNVQLEPAAGRIARGDGPPGTCFGGAVAAADLGAGSVVAVVSPGPFTNELLDEADNAVLAAAVLVPAPGTGVAVIDGPSVEPAPADDLVDLVGTPVRHALLQGGLGVLLWVLWRARRLGRPVVEDQPVSVAGSELVVAVGHLLDARRQPGEAAALLRHDVRRAAEARLGIGPDADLDAIAAAVAARTGMDPARAAAALGGRRVDTDDDLLAVAADLDRIRTDLFGRPT